MKSKLTLLAAIAGIIAVSFYSCNSNDQSKDNDSSDSSTVTTGTKNDYGGFSDQVAWGRHLVNMGGCNDCHTPKVMTKMGPMPDTTMLLAGHPANIPAPQIDRKEIESKGLIVTNDLSVWIGPWGITYAANLTPDDTSGLGNWTEDQFIRCLRQGKVNGAANSRPLLPPMSFVAESLNHEASDAELKAIFAYLKSIPVVHNVVPAPEPPVTAAKH